MSRGVILEDVSLNAHKVATSGNLIGSKLYADIGRFEHASPFVYLMEVVAQDGHVSYLASWVEAFGYRTKHARTSHTGQTIHMGGVSIL
jgi:hypothetical protein